MPTVPLLRFTHHARERMRERDYDVAEVRAALQAPERIVTVRRGATNHHGRGRDGRAIVVVIADDVTNLVITVMPDLSPSDR